MSKIIAIFNTNLCSLFIYFIFYFPVCQKSNQIDGKQFSTASKALQRLFFICQTIDSKDIYLTQLSEY